MNPKRTTTQPGFTLIELLVVVSIISMLTAIILPAIGKVKQQAKRTACQANLHAVAIAFKMYLDDYRDHTPNAADMPSLEPTRGKKSITTYMEPYLSDKRSLQCPADTPGAFDRIEQPQKTYFETEKSSYIYNSKLNGMRIKDYIASATRSAPLKARQF